MNLIKWQDNKIVIAPEAYGIKVFKGIWNDDRSEGKEKAILALTTLYFMYDPRSEYLIETDEEVRQKRIIEEMGLPSNWKPDKRFKEAAELYKRLTITTSAKILDSNRKAVEKIRKIIDAELPEGLDETKKIKYAVDLVGLISQSNILAESIAKTEKEIYKEVKEYSEQVMSNKDLKVGDYGLKNLFNT